MASFKQHRVLIASLFLPLTATLHDDPQPDPAAPVQSPPQPLPRPSPLVSILDDIATKTKVVAPVSTSTKEPLNPFVSFSSLGQLDSTDPHAIRLASTSRYHTVLPPTAELQPPAFRFPIRPASKSSSTRRPSIPRPGSGTVAPWILKPSLRGNGGLYNAVKSVDSSLTRKLWIGVLGSPADALDASLRRAVAARLLPQECVPVWVPDAEFSGCYDVFCHQVLWPTLHYAVPDAPKTKSFYESSSFEQYAAVNNAFADAIAALYEPGDIIWVNDYHLMLLPNLLREKIPNAMVSFFLHVAWPSSEIFRCLAVREALLRGILGADLVGFQTHNFARHFRNCVSRILAVEALPKGIQLEATFVDVAVFPMGIDVGSLTKKRHEPEVAEWVELLKQRYSGMKLIVGRDKLDEVQGVRQKIVAFEEFLQKRPEFRGKAVLIQVALFTSEENELHGSVADVVARVNSRFSTLTYQPIVFLHTHDVTFSQYLALLTVADAFLVTSLREGMALRTHEFVECQEGRARPLILSEFTGSYSFSGFRSCIPCNPWDTRATADAIHMALSMSDQEAFSRWKDLHGHVVTQTAQAFVTSFLTRSVRVHSEHQLPSVDTIPVLNSRLILPSYSAAHNRVIILDLEGTLWARDPKALAFDPPESLRTLLRNLASDVRNRIWLLSGMSMNSLESGLGDVGGVVGICAENGCFIKSPAADMSHSEWFSMVSTFDLTWKAAALEILHFFTERTPGSMVEEGVASVIWRFWTGSKEDATGRQWASRQAAEAQNHIWDSLGERYGLRIIPGANSFLVLPNKIGRSSAVGEILRKHSISADAPDHAPWTMSDPKLDANNSVSKVDFLLAISRDDKLLARLGRVHGAETCSTSGKGSDAKWRLKGTQGTNSLLLEIYSSAPN